jgi:hypothetical protein
MQRRLLIPIALAVFALGAAAASAEVATWNSGFNGWWPGGFGYSPLTVQASAYPCSVTAYGPTFNFKGPVWNQNYGGGTSCAGGVGEKTLTIYDQVLGPDGRTWFTISGSTFTGGPTSVHQFRMIQNRPASLGHAYRTVATTKLVVPNGHAGCSRNSTCSQTITITAISRALAP